MSAERYHVGTQLEVRESTGSPGRLTGVILPTGRVARDRPEIFVGEGVTTPSEGIRLLSEHRSEKTVMRFEPIRGDDGSLRVDHLLPDSPEGRALADDVRSGRKARLSVEFHALAEARVQGVREVRESLVTAVATVPAGSYHQAQAEVRGKQTVPLVWL